MREFINIVEARTYPLASRDGWYGNADYEARGGKLVQMSPDEYLSKVRPLDIDDTSRDNIDDLKNHIETGRTLDPLAIYPGGKEDGRHRAHAAKELGIREVPVLLFEDVRTKLRPSPKDIDAIRKVREKIRADEGGGGMCHFVSEWIRDHFGWEQASGTYLAPDGDVISGGGHLWNILPDGAIMDSTADQFGEGHDIRIIEPSDPDYHRYDIEWFEDWHPTHKDYDPTWVRARRKPEQWRGEYDFDAGVRLRKERGQYWWLNDLTHMKSYQDKQDEYGGCRDSFRDENEKDWQARRPVKESAECPTKKPRGVKTPEFTKDGRPIKFINGYLRVQAYVDGKEAGHMEIVCPHSSFGYANYFVVARVWVHEPFRGQGIATAMYNYAYRVGYRPLQRSKTLTDGGEGIWKKHIAQKRARGLDQDYHSGHPNRFSWRPLPKDQ